MEFSLCGVPIIWASHGTFTSSFCGIACFSVRVQLCVLLSPKFFARARLSFAPVTTGFFTLLLTTLGRLLRKVQNPVSGSLRKLQTTLPSLLELELGLAAKSMAPKCPLAGFNLVTLNVEHLIKTKVVALGQLLQWFGYPAMVLLQEVGVLRNRFACHFLY